jgi:hypothetical protein
MVSAGSASGMRGFSRLYWRSRTSISASACPALTPGARRATALRNPTPPADLRGRSDVQIEDSGRPQVHARAQRSELKAARQHAGDRVRCGIQRDVPSGYIRARTECASPQRVADEANGLGAGPVLLRQERAAYRRAHAQHIEEIPRNARRGKLLRIAQAGQVEVLVGERREPGKRAVLFAQECRARKRKRLDRSRRIGLRRIDQHQPLGMRVRQRPQQQRVGHAENRRVRADAQRQRDDGHQGEARALREHPDGVAEVSHYFHAHTIGTTEEGVWCWVLPSHDRQGVDARSSSTKRIELFQI